MAEPTIPIQELLWLLDRPYSQTHWHERDRGSGELQVDYGEAGRRSFSVRFEGITRGNLEVASSIAQALGSELASLYAAIEEDIAANPHLGPMCIVATRAFAQTCQEVIERNQALAHSHGLRIQMLID